MHLSALCLELLGVLGIERLIARTSMDSGGESAQAHQGSRGEGIGVTGSSASLREPAWIAAARALRPIRAAAAKVVVSPVWGSLPEEGLPEPVIAPENQHG